MGVWPPETAPWRRLLNVEKSAPGTLDCANENK